MKTKFINLLKLLTLDFKDMKHKFIFLGGWMLALISVGYLDVYAATASNQVMIANVAGYLIAYSMFIFIFVIFIYELIYSIVDIIWVMVEKKKKESKKHEQVSL